MAGAGAVLVVYASTAAAAPDETGNEAVATAVRAEIASGGKRDCRGRGVCGGDDAGPAREGEGRGGAFLLLGCLFLVGRAGEAWVCDDSGPGAGYAAEDSVSVHPGNYGGGGGDGDECVFR